MTEMQAAIGRIQLRRMADWHERRTANAMALADALGACDALHVPLPPAGIEHAWYKFYAFVQPRGLAEGWSRDSIMAAINAAGVPCYAGICAEVYLEKAFDGTGLRPPARLPAARALGETSLMFLVHPTLTDDEVRMTGQVVRSVMQQATRVAA